MAQSSLKVIVLAVLITASAGELEWEYYRKSCPSAENLIRSTMIQLYKLNPTVAPAMLRLVFHDCFIHGCDASLLLDADGVIASEKDAIPNNGLRGYDVVDAIKAAVEKKCPGIVSCADIIVLATREGVMLAGGPFYPLLTGRRDSNDSFPKESLSDLPRPSDNITMVLSKFATRKFNERETISLLGGHSVGDVYCRFFADRLSNFNGTGEPDPTLSTEFTEELRNACKKHTGGDLDPKVKMDYLGPRQDFGTLYYQSLLKGRGILFVDQQLTADEGTTTLVQAYASDLPLFSRDFASAMAKLSNLNLLTSPAGHIRLNCHRRN